MRNHKSLTAMTQIVTFPPSFSNFVVTRRAVPLPHVWKPGTLSPRSIRRYPCFRQQLSYPHLSGALSLTLLLFCFPPPPQHLIFVERGNRFLFDPDTLPLRPRAARRVWSSSCHPSYSDDSFSLPPSLSPHDPHVASSSSAPEHSPLRASPLVVHTQSCQDLSPPF